MAKKRQVKKTVTTTVKKAVRQAHRRSRYAVLFNKYKMRNGIIYVFDRQQKAKFLNREIDSVCKLLLSSEKFRGQVVVGETNAYPSFDTSGYDISHNVVYTIRDVSMSKNIKGGQLSGKAFKTLWKCYGAMVESGEIHTPALSFGEMHRIVTKLHERGLIVCTRFGTLWVKEDFKALMKEQDLLWTEMVIDFEKIPLRNLMGAK